MVVDECHRGYLLDREMSDAELSFRSQEDYISKYRRVLEYFDAVKDRPHGDAGAAHRQISSASRSSPTPIAKPSSTAILIDHEPPRSDHDGAVARPASTSRRAKRSSCSIRGPATIDLAHAPDEIQFEVESFNKKVVTVAFNRAVAEELASHIDPNLPGKTLIFAVTDAHADIVVEQVKKAFREAYGEIEDAAVRKITGSVDRVGELIRSFRNDALPKIAVTVDLLTTGIDVPRIENLVFLRRVNSRILYEQMLGRATRQCPEIGKEMFRIFDAVDLYSASAEPHRHEAGGDQSRHQPRTAFRGVAGEVEDDSAPRGHPRPDHREDAAAGEAPAEEARALSGRRRRNAGSDPQAAHA